VVEGNVTPEEEVWSDWLVKKPEVAESVVGCEGEPGAKLAMLGYRVLKAGEGYTLLELSPLTGRMHQLRVQCASRGHPVVGDEKYGSTRPFGPPSDLPRERVIALHARQLTLEHPFTREAMTWTAPLPVYWEAVGKGLPG
jgi:23S rRNA pseudouridine1911/1915/1917 synthase